MKSIIFNKSYDLKTEDNEILPAPQWMKYGLLMGALLLMVSVGYSGFRVLRHSVQKAEYEKMSAENIQLKNEIRAMEEQAIHVQGLVAFFNAQQAWLKERTSVTELLLKSFEALPKEVSIQEVNLKLLENSSSRYDLRIKCCKKLEADILQIFKMNLEKGGIIFQPRINQSSSKIEGVLTRITENL